LGKVISVWLIFLTLTPFTAPFATCDLTMSLAGRAPAPAHGTSPSTSLADASLSQALPLFRASARVRFMAFTESRTALDAPVPLATAFTRFLGQVRTAPSRLELTPLRI